MERAGEKERKVLLTAPVWKLSIPTFNTPTKSILFDPAIIDNEGKMFIDWNNPNIFRSFGGYLHKKNQIMVEQRYNAVYSQRAELSEKFGNIRPLISLVHEFAESIVEGDSTALPCIKKIQRNLYEKGILPFEVDSIDDFVKVEMLPSGDVHDFLWYVYLAYRRIEEDWHWDERLQQYVSRNSVWLKHLEKD